MHLYHLTLQRCGAIHGVAYGSFSAPKRHELAVIMGSHVRLFEINARSKRLAPLGQCTVECFGRPRSLCALRVAGSKVDVLALTSDSGRMVLLRVDSHRL